MQIFVAQTSSDTKDLGTARRLDWRYTGGQTQKNGKSNMADILGGDRKARGKQKIKTIGVQLKNQTFCSV